MSFVNPRTKYIKTITDDLRNAENVLNSFQLLSDVVEFTDEEAGYEFVFFLLVNSALQTLNLLYLLEREEEVLYATRECNNNADNGLANSES